MNNTLVAWPIYPKLFAIILAIPFLVLPTLKYSTLVLGVLILWMLIGPPIFKLTYKKLKLSFLESVFFFFFAMSGFFVMEYIIGEILVPQVIGFILLPLFPALFFSENKKERSLSIPLLFLIYLLHSATAVLIGMATVFSFAWKQTRSKTKRFFILASPILLLKSIHFFQLLTGMENIFLSDKLFFLRAVLGTERRINLPPVYHSLSLQELILSGLLLYIFIPILLFKNKKNRTPLAYWALTLFGISLLPLIIFDVWNSLFNFGWPKIRYLGFAWLSLAIMAPFFYKNLSLIKQKAFILLSSFFIVFQFGLAWQRETVTFEDIEKKP